MWEKYEQAREGKTTRRKPFLQRMGDAQGRLLDSLTGLDQSTLCNESVAGDWAVMDILILDSQAMELGGTTLEEALVATQAIQLAAELSAEEEIAKADRILQDAQTQASAKIAEALQILAQAEADADAKITQSQDVADAAIAASVREAAAKLREADALMEQSKPAAAE